MDSQKVPLYSWVSIYIYYMAHTKKMAITSSRQPPPWQCFLISNMDHWAEYLEIGKGVALCTCCSPVPRQSLFPPYLAFSTVAAASKAGFELPTYRWKTAATVPTAKSDVRTGVARAAILNYIMYVTQNGKRTVLMVAAAEITRTTNSKLKIFHGTSNIPYIHLHIGFKISKDVVYGEVAIYQ